MVGPDLSGYNPGENRTRTRLQGDFDKLSLDTKAVVTEAKILANAHPVTVPIYHTSNYRFDSVDQFEKPNHGDNYEYQRSGNPTCEAAEVAVCALEGGAATLFYNSGTTAGNVVLMQLSAGDHLICQAPIYGGLEMFVSQMLVRWGIEVTFISAGTEFCREAEAAIKKNTKMLYIECPCNPLMTFIDMESAIKLAKRHGILVSVDATFSSPYLLQPIKYGADFVIHSCSKFIGGHSDVIGGCVTTATIDQWRILKRQQTVTGSALSPFDASLIIRGLKTLPVRMLRICDSAMKIAKFLESHPKVHKVFYPGLESDASHANAARVMRHFGGMIAIDLQNEERAFRLLQSVRVIVLAVSLGGTETLIEYPIIMSRGREAQRTSKMKVKEGLVRLSVGLEDVDDLIADLGQALAKI